MYVRNVPIVCQIKTTKLNHIQMVNVGTAGKFPSTQSLYVQLHQKAVDELHRITNGEPLEMDKQEKLFMLIVLMGWRSRGN